MGWRTSSHYQQHKAVKPQNGHVPPVSSPGRFISEFQFVKSDSGSQRVSELKGTFVLHTGMGREATNRRSPHDRIQPGSRYTDHSLNGKTLSSGFNGILKSFLSLKCTCWLCNLGI